MLKQAAENPLVEGLRTFSLLDIDHHYCTCVGTKSKLEIETKKELTDKEGEKRVGLQARKHNLYTAYVNSIHVLKYV